MDRNSRDSGSHGVADPTVSLDQAIDAIAREMTALDPPAGIRADVLTRIEGGPRSGSALLPRLAMAAGVAMIVLAIAATIWFVSPRGGPESTIAKHDTSSTSATGATHSQPQASGTIAGTGAVTAGTAPAPRPSGTLASAALAHDVQSAGAAGPAARGAAAEQPDENGAAAPDSGPSPLPQPDPIFIPDLGPEAIHVPDIGIEPLGDLKPITIQDIPVGSGEPPRRDER